jgi:hypothetical protein
MAVMGTTKACHSETAAILYTEGVTLPSDLGATSAIFH